ncbi:cysteine and histidine-rich domain-containing protein morgana [Diabrotica virgifera virgifera]|uniref:Cysteine and histidine-rich domain-containing protein n=1 Tax=Diabrotica virgifera virgifera TaxID=50390 RepID=A0A6P7FUG0_DIAVI|nr:cysteine and histidine-rich domain-containing protein morgana [Diabrotica virgifera virgifera]
MSNEKALLQCYNRGCGQKFDPDKTNEDSCRHHPGEPVFHDAYKGWSCCNKKCTDFTEFLNIQGCTLSKHSNIKPVEPEKPVAKDVDVNEVIEVKPIVQSTMERPSFNTPLVTIKAQVAPSLQQQLKILETKQEVKTTNLSGEIVIGTTCKNGGCGTTYEGPQTNDTTCTYHPGVPIFHEGLKFWSCCQKRTTDFDAFLNQVGCETGTHIWSKEAAGDETVQCRWDFHQTGSHVVVSIYAKEYCLKESIVKLNPVRMYAKLVFPQQSNASFLLDNELKGIINVEASQVTMYGTKVEIKMKKAEAGSWSKLGTPVTAEQAQKAANPVGKITRAVDAVDLDDL